MVATSDAWIVQRTGIRERHIASASETTSVLGIRAAEAALANAGLEVGDIDLLICATSTPDFTFPSTATQIQSGLGMHHGAAFDLQAVCSGFIYAVSTADKFLTSGAYRRALVVGAETFSRIIDWTDRSTCVLFGGRRRGHRPRAGGRRGGFGRSWGPHVASALRRPISRQALCGRWAGLDGDDGPSAHGGAGRCSSSRSARSPTSSERPSPRPERGQTTSTGSCPIRPTDASSRPRPTSSASRREKVVLTVERHGNTSAASIPLALDTAQRDGRIKVGDLVMLEAIGGGFAWASALIRW